MMTCKNCGNIYEGMSCPNCCGAAEASSLVLQHKKYQIANTSFFIVEYNHLKGVVDKEGNEIIPVEYDNVCERLKGIEFLNEFSLFYAEKFGEVYLYSTNGRLVYHVIGKIDTYRYTYHSRILPIKDNDGRYYLFDMRSCCEFLSNVYVKEGLFMNRYRPISIGGALNIYDSEYNLKLSISDANTIKYFDKGHVLIAYDNNISETLAERKVYDTSLNYLGVLPAEKYDYYIIRIIANQYALCRNYSSMKTLYGVYDLKVGKWSIPMEYLNIDYDDENHQFKPGQRIQDVIKAKEQKDNKKKLIGALMMAIGIFSLIVTFAIFIENFPAFIITLVIAFVCICISISVLTTLGEKDDY